MTHQLVKGTRLHIGEDASRMEAIIRSSEDIARGARFSPVRVPSLDFSAFYAGRLDGELRMYEFADRKGRALCLRPECTNTLSAIAPTLPADTLLYYTERCWRYDTPQAGRHREFTQFGVEWLNPTQRDGVVDDRLVNLALKMVMEFIDSEHIQLVEGADRGANYYIGGRGFEIRCPLLGGQKQIVGGGAYENGAGFAFGVERVALAARLQEVE